MLVAGSVAGGGTDKLPAECAVKGSTGGEAGGGGTALEEALLPPVSVG